MASKLPDPSSPGTDWAIEHLEDLATESLQDPSTSFVTFRLPPQKLPVVEGDETKMKDHVNDAVDELKETLSKQLALLLADSPFCKSQEDIHQALKLCPSDLSFFSSYCKFVKDLVPSSNPLFSKAIDLPFGRIGFEVTVSGGEIHGETVLESLGHEALSQIQHLTFCLNQDATEFLDKKDSGGVESWIRIMERTRDVLPYHKLHLVLDYNFYETTKFGVVLDVLKKLPRMKHCSLCFSPRSSSAWDMEIKRVVRHLINCEKEPPHIGVSRIFHKYSALPKELRLLVLSFAGLVPTKRKDGLSPEEAEEIELARGTEEFSQSKEDKLAWTVSGPLWNIDRECCGKCAGRMSYPCCCNFQSCCVSTICGCPHDFVPLLLVSRQFRAESSVVLFSNDFVFCPKILHTDLLDNLQQSLDWPLTIPNIHFMKNVALCIGEEELGDWYRDEEELFRPKLTKYLQIFVENSGPLTVLTLTLGSLRRPMEPWRRTDGERLRELESDLCQIVESIYLANPSRCKIYIDWGTGVRDSIPDEPSSVTEDQTDQIVWHKSQWLRNSEDFFWYFDHADRW